MPARAGRAEGRSARSRPRGARRAAGGRRARRLTGALLAVLLSPFVQLAPRPPSTAGAATPTGGTAAASGTVWLCRPGLTPNPCTPGLSTTVYSPTLRPLRTTTPPAVRHPAIDCFYVYPTVSDQKTGNADLSIDPEERSIALYQVARYSQVCRIFAPIYRQVTLAAIGIGSPTTPPDSGLAFSSLESAFRDYLHNDNHGRGFVLIGHSQGAFILRQLIHKDIDPDPQLRSRLVSAILLGGNVLVKPGPSGVGGDFRHVPACRSARQTGCVIAFSTFDQPVPPNSLFGRPGGPGSSSAPHGSIVLCTNPAALGGGKGLVTPIVPTAPFAPGTSIAAGVALLHMQRPVPAPRTVWYSLPGAYRAYCSSTNGAHVLEVSAVDGAETLTPSPDPTWGLHLVDANIALGNLVQIVSSQATAYKARHS